LCSCGELLTHTLLNLVDVELEVDEDEPDPEIEALQHQVAQLDERNKELEGRSRGDIRDLAAAYFGVELRAVLGVLEACETEVVLQPTVVQARLHEVVDSLRAITGQLR
jgi:hypothetical protein